jgi:acetyl esterase/lipase
MPRMSLPLRVATWLALIAVTAAVWTDSDRAFRRLDVPSPVVVHQDVVYRVVDGHRLSLDVYLPPGGEMTARAGPRRAAILAIHGGSWIGGSKRLFRPSLSNRHPTAVRLAESGYVVVAADYRLARPGTPGWPAARDDLRDAVRWIRRHSVELGVDPGRIAALGLSAGGHLAALLGTSAGLPAADDDSRVQAVVSFYGPSDLERLPLHRAQRLWHEPARVFLGDDPTEASAKARDASPINHVRGDAAPMLLIHGTRDRWVPIEQSEALARALEAAGVTHQLIRVDGARHGFDASVQEPRDRDLRPEILDFLQSVWNAQTR